MTAQNVLAHIKIKTVFLISNTSYFHRAAESCPCCEQRLQETEDVDFQASLNTFLLRLMLFKLLRSILEKVVLHPFPEPLMKGYD